MDTKTRKSEALAHLRAGGLSGTEIMLLNTWTAKQAGFYVVRVEEAEFGEKFPSDEPKFMLMQPDGKPQDSRYLNSESYAWAFVPDYIRLVSSIGYCYRLPIPEGWFWKTRTPVMIAAEIYSGDGQRQTAAFGDTLQIAMLTAWWQLQPD